MSPDRKAAIPIEVHPDPVLRYTAGRGTPVITATNGAFEDTFEGISTESPVSAVFDEFGIVVSTGADDPQTHLLRGDAIAVYLDGFDECNTYLARVIPVDDETGFLVFSPLDDILDVAETAGIGQVASVISHDLRNPLDVAKAHLRAARETGDSEHFEAVADAHDRMERIIRDVLTLARGPEAVDPSEQISLERAAEDAWQSVDTERATLDISDTLPTVIADADRVRRLFENLFRNSVEHADMTATVRVGSLDDGFYVADDGPGVPPDEREAVFDPGYSIKDGGTGLGLAIVARIVAAHGWDVGLTAGQEGGARFEIRW